MATMILKPDNDILHTFQGNINTVRILLGWTTEELADILGLSRTAVNNYQRGHILFSTVYYYAFWTIFNYASEHCGDNRRTYFINALIDGENYNREQAEAIKSVVDRVYKRCAKRNGAKRASETVIEALANKFSRTCPMKYGADFDSERTERLLNLMQEADSE